jgi:outer membrane protein TolC
LANQTLWLFSGPNQMNTASTISYSLVQPLLFQAGRKIALESLTQSERTLLYSVRDLARFRKEFFTSVVGGQSGFLSLLRQRQIVLNERDNIRRAQEQLIFLKAISSQRTIVFYETLNALPQGIVFPPNVSGQIRFSPLEQRLYFRGRMSLRQQQTLLGLSVDPAYQTALQGLIQRRIYVTLNALPAGLQFPAGIAGQLTFVPGEQRLYWNGLMSEAQEKLLETLSESEVWKTAVAALTQRLRSETLTTEMLQLQSRVLRSENTLRRAEQSYQDLIDQFKIVLGLPPNMPLSIDMSMLNQFKLIDPKISQTEQDLKDFVLEWAKLDELDPDPAQLRTVIIGLNNLQIQVQSSVLDLIQADLAVVKKGLPGRLASIESADDRRRIRRGIERDETLLNSIKDDYAKLSRALKLLESEFGKDDTERNQALRGAFHAGIGPALAQSFLNEQKKLAVGILAEMREELLKITQNAQVIQIGLRVELIALEEFKESFEDVQKEALANRLDLKNARARVMDARRRVEIEANRLEAVLNLRVEGDVRTPTGNKPLDFRGRQSSFRVGLGFTAPLDQVNARNAYRDAQIDYQRARRTYMALEDQIKLQVRQSWRNLDALRKNFETARQNVRFSALQFDSAVEQAAAPGQPVNRNSGLTLLNALSSVLTAQNELIGIWVSYERSRLNIHRDMGKMEIDAQGVWTNDYYQRRLPAPIAIPPQPASAEGRSVNETRTISFQRPEFHNLERIRGSVRIRRRDGIAGQRVILAAGDRKRSSKEKTGRKFFEGNSPVSGGDSDRGPAGRWSVRVSRNSR